MGVCSNKLVRVMPGKVIVYGGRGGLGVVIVNHFKASGHWVLCVDVAENEASDANVKVSLSATWVEQEQGVCQGVAQALGGDKVGGCNQCGWRLGWRKCSSI